MTKAMTISKARQLAAALDYNKLRSEGLRYIESMAHELWTDYNTHDPGITILEALCYAITELGYRNAFDIKDLLADGKGNIAHQQPFFTPRTILTNEPYSITDFRKLLIDLKGVNNAWLYIPENLIAEGPRLKKYLQTEVPLFPECKEDRLVYHSTHHLPIDMRGLYHVRLDLDQHDQLGDLNSSNIDFTIYAPALRGVKVECFLPRYNKVDRNWLQAFYKEVPVAVNASPVKVDQFGKTLRWHILVVYQKGANTHKFEYEVSPSLRLNKDSFDELLESELEQPSTQQQIMALYFQKTMLISKYVQQAWERLHAHRNLCEDWWTVDTIRNTPIAFCADIEVTPSSDIEKVYAHIVVAIEAYLNPPVKFHALRELMNDLVPVETIFEGPVLEHGFLLTNEIEAATLKTDIYVSDLINILMDIEGVVAVRNVLLTAYADDGQPRLPSQKWCLHIDPDHKPVLDVERSKLLFFKNQLPYRVRAEEAFDTLLYLRGLNKGHKIVGAEQDLIIPNGRHLEIWQYSSIQHDLPDVYGIGKAGLPETASNERKAEARQLKAYLMFYDQVLAGFFSQLYNAKALLGLDPELRQSYFQQYLKDWNEDNDWGIKAVDPVYKEAATLQQVLQAPQPGEAPDISLRRQQLIETEETLIDRRQRFLDHLIARFSESFNEYVLTLHASSSDIDQQELIRDKIRFIEDYPVSSSRRGTACNILGNLWDTDNISGFQNRLARLTGINDPSQRNLFCYPSIVIVNEGTAADPKFTFALKDNDANTWLIPIVTYSFYEAAERMVNEWFENLLIPGSYSIEAEGSKFRVYLHTSTGEKAGQSVSLFDDEIVAGIFIQQLIATFQPSCDEEGMHLVEHFLLRPMFPAPIVAGMTPEEVYKLMMVCLPKDCLFCGEEDPYSFRVTIVLPYWPERFRDFNFRRFLETAAHREAPAHVHVKVCWLSFTAMQSFEKAYQNWLEALKAYKADQLPDDVRRDALRKASNELVKLMSNLHSIYPEATLHDCDEGTSNPVRLGNTNLGSL